MIGRRTAGGVQPVVEAAVGLAANCRNTSIHTESPGLLSKGRAKRATGSPITLVRGGGAVGDSKKATTIAIYNINPQSYN